MHRAKLVLMSVLVTGGCGYIGAHVVVALRARGEDVVIIDDLSTGKLSRIQPTPVEIIDLAATSAYDRVVEIMRDAKVDSVIHLAAKKQVGESVLNPTSYFRVNLNSLSNVIDACRSTGVKNFVFSSSAAVYGAVSEMVSEEFATNPINPYGESKLVGEWLTNDSAVAYGMAVANLRYFNVAGAGAPELGDTAALNIVPMVFENIAHGRAPQVFGDNYNTPDGTCIRDYIHVSDLADAHVAALEKVRRSEPGCSQTFNVGTGRGFSVVEVIQTILEISHSELQPEFVGPRPGDPAVVIADPGLAKRELGWTAKRDMHEIIRSAWDAYTYLQQVEVLPE